MLFLSERPAIPGAGAADDHAWVSEALIKEARRRRRRRWIRGTAAVLLAAAGSPRAANVTASRPAAAGACAGAVAYGPLPAWARTGFHPPTMAMPYVLGAHGEIVAVLWADPLITPAPADHNNKILWVSKTPDPTGASLQITAQRVANGTAAGPVQQRTVMGGPGPSIIDMPAAGCWQFTLRWSGHTDTVDLAYASGS